MKKLVFKLFFIFSFILPYFLFKYYNNITFLNNQHITNEHITLVVSNIDSVSFEEYEAKYKDSVKDIFLDTEITHEINEMRQKKVEP